MGGDEREDEGGGVPGEAKPGEGGEGGTVAGTGLVPSGPVRDVGPRRQGGLRLEAWQVDVVAREWLRSGNASVAVTRARVREYRYPFAVVVERVMSLPEVVARIEEWRVAGVPEQADGGRLTRVLAEEKLVEILEDAQRGGEPDVALKALDMWGKWNGLTTVKHEVTHRRGVEELTDAELEELVRSRLRETSIEGGGDGDE